MTVDGAPVEPGETFAYRGCLVSGVPNFAFCVGYVNASWTLRADLVARYVTRLLGHMDAQGYAVAPPRRRMPTRPLLDLSSGYIQRSAPCPAPGRPHAVDARQNYLRDRWRLGVADVTEEMTMVTWKQPRYGLHPAVPGLPR